MSVDAAALPPTGVANRGSVWKQRGLLAIFGAIASLWSVGQLALASSLDAPHLALSILMVPLAAVPAVVILLAALRVVASVESSHRVARRALRASLDGLALAIGFGAVQLINYNFLAETSAAGFVPFLLYLGLFPAGALVLARRAITRRTPHVIAAAKFATIWTGLEVLRGELMLGGYPWHLTAHHVPPQIAAYLGASIIGAYGLGWVLVYCASRAVLPLARHHQSQSIEPPASMIDRFKANGWRVMASITLLFVIMGLFTSPLSTPQTARLGLLQTNIPQSNKLAADLKQRVQDTVAWSQAAVTLAQDSAAAGSKVDAVLWPETVFSGLTLDAESLRVERAAGLAYRWAPGTAGVDGINGQLPSTFFADTMLKGQQASGVPWLVGTIAYDNLALTMTPQGRLEESHAGKFNSVVMLDRGAITPSRYDKVELMAFGEYIPLAWRWPALQASITAIGAGGMEFDLKHGGQRTLFTITNASGSSYNLVTPICFEACSHSACAPLVFDHNWLGATSRRANLIFNPTNDGWFYNHDLGRRLHLLAARWRSLELATPMVRVANTGISCWIDAQGAVHDVLPPREFGAKVVTIPLPEMTAPPSLYARVLHHIRWVILGLLCVQIAAMLMKRRGPASVAPLQA